MGMFMRRIIDWIRKNIIAVCSASVAALVAAWIQSQLRELFKTYVYGWIVDRAKEFVVEREAIMIATLVTYAAPIITAVIVFLVVLWLWPRPKSRNIHHVEIREHLAIGASLSKVVVPSAIVSDNELVGWEKLYEEYEAPNGKELRLRFLPDTNDQAGDALLLICYGYKCIRNIDSIRIRLVHSQIEDLLARAPGSRQSSIARYMASISPALGSDERDFGQKCIQEGTVVRVDLSKGGRYRLTNSGENKAKALARDLIERA